MAPDRMREIAKQIPRGENVVFSETGFFTRQRPPGAVTLPSPAAVREEGLRQHGIRRAKQLNRPPIVKFPSLGLIVKYGALVSIAEAQCLFMIRRYLPEVPVPEMYGWSHDGDQGFIYMELVGGKTLEESWGDLAEEERVAVCGELRDLVASWRNLPQRLFSDSPFIGNVVGEPLLDWIFVNTCSPADGPFRSVSEFHDWFTSTYGPNRLEPWKGRSPHPYRSHFLDDVPIVFTHADLHPSNIILAPHSKKSEPPHVVAVIDWQQSGWYPAYWEYCKSRWVWSEAAGEAWDETYLPLILEVAPYKGDGYDYWDHFVAARGI